MKWLMILICLFLAETTLMAAEPEELYAQSAVLMDAKSGRVLFEKNGDTQKAMASTTKIMTCILALENGELDAEVVFSKEACSQPKVHLGASEGKTFLLKDLLYSLMLESHNDSAVAIAEHVAGTVEGFAAMMNEKAIEIGCDSTHFVTPNGLDGSDAQGNHVTTASDLAKIMSYCVLESMESEEFLEITQTPEYSFQSLDGTENYYCANHNSFLNMNDDAISGKTGYTSKAGYCYVGALENDGRVFVVSLLACGWPNQKNYKWEDTKKLMEYALENYEYRDVYEALELEDICVKNGIPKDGDLFAEAEADAHVETNGTEELEILLGKEEEIHYIAEYEKEISAPADPGEQIGCVTYYLGEQRVAEYPIVISEKVGVKSIEWYFEKIAEKYIKMA